MATSSSITLPSGLKIDQPTSLFYNASFHLPLDPTSTFPTVNPATGKEIVTLNEAKKEDVDLIVQAARKAYESDEWQDLSSTDRGKLLFKLADLVEEDKHIFAELESYDAGKTVASAILDVEEAIGVIRYYAGWADKIVGESHRMGPDKHGETLHEPLGVCAAILPFNYPLALACWKLAPALACGNVIVVLPSPETPLSVLYLAPYFEKAGFPASVYNVLPGKGMEAGAALSSHLDVDKISFTGSTATGRKIMEASAKSNLKSVTLELGGKSPAIVFDDAELDQAVKWTCLYGMFLNQSQVCSSTTRIYVQDGIYDAFVAAFKEATLSSIIVGSPNDESTFHGPLISKAQHTKVLDFIETGKKEGAKVLVGGEGAKEGEEGFYVQPTVFVDCEPEMTLMNEEIFGPVCCIAKFSTIEEVLRKANDTQYGLAAAVFTENIRTAHRMVRKLNAGMVFVNSSGDASLQLPFGGNKSSGFGRELGSYALHCYTQPKAVHWNLNQRV
ncbi:aldehyde dehydrogenase-like protein [Mrakia frigida]|uniref:aldehyde dehydrogenase-like protein n=1 Tax=Mrakia frigida TaxID=29902 RepID=UPI003FCC1472